MPTYEYLCEKCGTKSFKRKSISKRNEIEICKCGQKMVRLIGIGSSFILKGKGFYCNREKKK